MRITHSADTLLRMLSETTLRNLRNGKMRWAAPALLALAIVALALGLAAPAAAQTARLAPLRGTVYLWADGQLQRVPRVAVSTGLAQTRTDERGRFEFAANQRSGRIMAVKPGFDVVRRDVYGDNVTIVLREIVARGLFVSFTQAPQAGVQRWILDLVERDLINAVVIDIKEEAGLVVNFAGTETTDAIGATAEPNGMAEFLQQLGELGVYRIGRIVTFMDSYYTAWHPQDTLQHIHGYRFVDGGGNRWSSPFSPDARRYNIEIGVAAAPYVDEVQFDYVRLPYEDGLAARAIYASVGREAAINAFAEDAAEALHLAGAAVSFDLFGIIAVSVDDAGLGQSIGSLSRHLDYISPMLYPSGWSRGSFGLSYPPSQPGLVIRRSMAATMARLAEDSHAEVRPWLQDFTDYQERHVWYGPAQVRSQIVEAAAAGGYGFMLWDARRQYQESALEGAADLAWTPRWAAP